MRFLIVAGSALAILVIGLLGMIMWGVSTYNRAISLETQFTAALQNREALYDNMVKQVQEKFSVAKFERKTVVDLINGAVAGRDGGQMFKMVQEQYPQVNTKLFEEVMATIGGKRDEFTRSQQNLMQIAADHTKLRNQVPSNIIVGGRKALEFTVVSSTGTKETMQSGKDDRTLIDTKP